MADASDKDEKLVHVMIAGRAKKRLSALPASDIENIRAKIREITNASVRHLRTSKILKKFNPYALEELVIGNFRLLGGCLKISATAPSFMFCVVDIQRKTSQKLPEHIIKAAAKILKILKETP